MAWEFVRLMTRKSSAAQRNYTNRLTVSHSRLLETQLNQERDRINMRRLTAGLVIFALVVKVGSEAFTDLFTSTGCNSVSGPASILREIKISSYTKSDVPSRGTPIRYSMLGRFR